MTHWDQVYKKCCLLAVLVLLFWLAPQIDTPTVLVTEAEAATYPLPRPQFAPSNFDPVTNLSPGEINGGIRPFTPAELEAVRGTTGGGVGSGAGGGGGAGGAGGGNTVSEEQPIVVLGDGLLNGLYGFVIVFFGKLVVWGAGLFSYGITNFAIGFGELYLTWGIGVAVEQSWRTIRDIFNLTFIFGLIYIGFRMILFTDDNQSKRTLITLIGAALLVNFSLFITKFVIDIANSLAAVIFNEGFISIQDNVGAAFLNLIGLGTVLNAQDELYNITNLGVGVGLALIFGTMFFMSVAAFVFAAGGILLMIRAIVLTFFMIFSPVMFIGWVFPGMASYSSKYWKSFLGQAFMAPAYVFCIYVSFKILSGFKRPLAEGSNISAALLSKDSSLVVPAIVFFILAVVLLIASMKVAQTMGAFGAGTALAVGNNLRGRMQVGLGGATAGVSGRIGRNTIGAGANAFTQSNFGKKIATNSLTGERFYKAASGVADSSFDVRQVSGVGKAMGIGEGKKGGYATRLKESEKAEKKFLDDLDTIDADNNPEVKAARDIKVGAEGALKNKQNELKVNTANERQQIKNLNAEYAGASEQRKQDISAQINALQAAISTKEKEAEGEISNLQTAVKAAETALEKTTSEVEYGHQLQYIKTLDKWQKTKRRFQTAGVAASAVGAGVLTGGILPAAIAAGAGASVYGSTYHTSSDVKALKKEYGDDGTKKKKSKAQKDRIKDLAEEVGKENKDKTSDTPKPETT